MVRGRWKRGESTLSGSVRRGGVFRGRCPRLVRLKAHTISEVEVLTELT